MPKRAASYADLAAQVWPQSLLAILALGKRPHDLRQPRQHAVVGAEQPHRPVRRRDRRGQVVLA